VTRVRTVLANAPLRVRVLAVAAILVTITSVVTGWLGTALLSGYLLGRGDAQLRGFASVASHILAHPRPPARPPAGQGPGLPTQFYVRVVSADGHGRVAADSVHVAHPPQLSAAQQRVTSGPVTVPAAGAPGHHWRVLVRALPGGRHLVIGYSLDGLDSTVTRLEIADAAAGAVALVVLVILGIPLVRVSLAPLAPRSPPVTCPSASTICPGGPRWAGWPGRSTRCWAGSRRRTGPVPKGRRGRWIPRTGCGGSSPTPATSSARR
jgi:hypothetical protein